VENDMSIYSRVFIREKLLCAIEVVICIGCATHKYITTYNPPQQDGSGAKKVAFIEDSIRAEHGNAIAQCKLGQRYAVGYGERKILFKR
jgi:hypothetical protein